MANLVGQTLGQYKLVRLIGEGGMAAVYQANQESMNRDVAIKVIKPNMVDMEKFVERFALEARTVASLSHAHILKVFDYGHHEDIVYLVMEFLTGGSLDQLIRKGAIPVERTAVILDQMAGALDYAHSKGIIHRDLKPDNVLFDEAGNAFLTDFGLAKILNASQKLTQTGAALGTPTYMAPEQWRGQPADARTDVYAMGVMLFEMLTGNLPFNADSALSLMYQHIHEFPPMLSSQNPEIPLVLEDVLERALAKDPDDRFQSAGQLAQEFRAALVGDAPAQRAPGSTSQAGMRSAVKPNTATSGTGRQSGTKPPSGSMRQSAAPAGSPTASDIQSVPFLKKVPTWLWAALVIGLIIVVGIAVLRGTRLLGIPPVPTVANLPTDVPTATTDLATPIAQTMAAQGTGTAQAIASFTATPTSTSTSTATPTSTSTPTIEPSPTLSPTPALVALVMPSAAEQTTCQSGAQPPPGAPPSRTGVETLTGHSGAVTSIAFSPDRKTIASGSSDKTARIWDIASTQLVHTFTGHKDAVYSVAFSPNSLYLLTGGADNTAILWEVASGEILRTFDDFSGAVTSVAFSCDGRHVLVASADRTAKLWDVQTGELSQTFTGAHSLPIVHAVFSPTGRSIATASEDNTAVIWDIQTGDVHYTLKQHTATVHRVIFSQNGRSILTGSADGTARIWDASTGKLLQTLNNSRQPVFAIAFTPDGRQVFIAGKDGIVRGFDPNTGQFMRAMTQATAAVLDIRVMDIFPMIATAVTDNNIRLWYLPAPPGQR